MQSKIRHSDYSRQDLRRGTGTRVHRQIGPISRCLKFHSYNLINGRHATENGYFNIDVVRKDWAFKGVLISD